MWAPTKFGGLIGGRRAAGFSPLVFGADLWSWHDASDAGTRTITGSGVSTWTDKSGHGHHGTQSTDAKRPTVLAANQNGLDVLAFNYTAVQELSIPDMSSLTEGCAVFLARRNNDPTTQGSGADGGPVLGTGAELTANASAEPYTDGNIYSGYGSTARKSAGNPTPSLSAWFLFSFRSAPSDWELFVNGTSLYSTGTNTVGYQAAPTIGCHHVPTADFFYDGRVAEIVQLSIKGTTLDREKLEGYLAWKWGVQAILPGGHTYAGAPP